MRSASTNAGDGSAAAASTSRRTSSAVSAPVPAPTSSARMCGSTPAKSANSGARRVEKRPMNLSYARSEVQILRSIHVSEQRLVELDDGDVEAGDRAADRELAARRARAAPSCDRRRAAGRSAGAPRRGTRPRARAARRPSCAACRPAGRRRRRCARRAARRRDRGSRRAPRSPSASTGNGSVLVALADRDALVARLAERPPGALGERLVAEARERLRRAEARARAADEQHARQTIRHGSV